MASLSILRIPAEDSQGSFVLAQATSAGPRTLDLKLVATEGQAPYTVKLKHKNFEQLRAANSPSSPDEWESILTAVLYNRESLDGVEAVAKIFNGESIDIIIRRRVEGINQKLGTVTLKRKDDEGINTLDWCSEAVLAREKAKADLATTVARAVELESTVAELKDQLEELIRAKQTDETAMLEKFRGLLNEKKAKIRQQEQQLRVAAGNGLHQPPNFTTHASQIMKQEMEDSPPTQPKRRTRRVATAVKASTSSRPKRKAAQATVSEDEDEDSDDGFEKMDVDPKPSDEMANMSEDQQTTDDETGSESEDGPSVPSPGPSSRQPQANKTAPRPSTLQAENRKELPPSRTLPFATPKPAPVIGSDTESEDDEL